MDIGSGTSGKVRHSIVAARILVAALAVVLLSAFVYGCGKKDEKSEEELAREWTVANFSEGKTPPPKHKPLPADLVIEVPDSVKARYSDIIMAVGDRKTKVIKKFNVTPGVETGVPGTPFKVKVSEYLPTWTLKGKVATSRKDDPVDPAVRAVISKGGEVVFDGFVFQHHKTPSFMTDEFVIGLVGAVEKKK